MLLKEWETENNITFNNWSSDIMKWYPDIIDARARESLWWLSDYFVSHVTGGSIWLHKRGIFGRN